jgi:hypothetical protein
MILVYFVAGAGGYQVRSMDMGIHNCKDFHLKSNLRNQESALRYANVWVKHTGKMLDTDCYIVTFPCFANVYNGFVHTAKVFLSAVQDDRIYEMPEFPMPLRTDYTRYAPAIAKLLELAPESDDMQRLMKKINLRSRNSWLDNLLFQYQRYLDNSTNGPLLAQWVKT